MKKTTSLLTLLLLSLFTVRALAIPVQITSHSEFLSTPGTTIGTGTGDLVGGVLTYEMELVLDLEIFNELTTLAVYGTLFDGTPPAGNAAISSCEGLSIICDDVVLDVFRPETFLSGGPFSETEVTILISGPSASGRTGPSTMTITPGASVPLPGAVWLVGTALIVLVGVRRQSRL